MKTCTHWISQALLGLTACLLAAGAVAQSVGRVNVMDVDEVRDAASISRAKAEFRAQGGGGEGGDSSSGGCSDLNIGNVSTKVGQRAPRNVTVVIEGPVIQENKCR